MWLFKGESLSHEQPIYFFKGVAIAFDADEVAGVEE
jgi:hypothetical protein